MPHTDTIPVSASIASTGPGIRYIGNWAYAYNSLDVTTVELSLLEFTSGSGLIIAKIQFNKTNEDGDDFLYQVYLNDEAVSGWVNFYGATGTSINNVTTVLIPPFSKVKCTADNVSGGIARPINCGLVGRVYGAE